MFKLNDLVNISTWRNLNWVVNTFSLLCSVDKDFTLFDKIIGGHIEPYNIWINSSWTFLLCNKFKPPKEDGCTSVLIFRTVPRPYVRPLYYNYYLSKTINQNWFISVALWTLPTNFYIFHKKNVFCLPSFYSQSMCFFTKVNVDLFYSLFWQ